jgi:DNA-binding CsgD family transcriptional regulator/ketosteroid isomerase-like protein
LDSQIEIVDRWYAAWDQHDVDALLSVCHPEVEVVPENPLLPRLPGTSFHGHVGLRSLAAWSYENFPNLRVAAGEVWAVHGVIAASATWVFDETSTPVETRATDTLFDLQLGRIRRARVFEGGSHDFETAQEELVLTEREREVFQLLARGMKGPEIAAELFISPATVRTHIQNGIDRLGARSRVEALMIAVKHGEIEA